MVKKQKKFKEYMKSGNYNKIIASILTIVIISLVIFTGPTKAFVLGLDITDDSLNDQGKIIFTASIDIENMDKYLPVKELELSVFEIDGITSKICKFNVDGSKISTDGGCEGITITKINAPSDNEGGYGYS